VGRPTPIRIRVVSALADAGPAGGASKDPEAAIRRLCEAGDLQAARACAVEAYGPQVLGFLVTMLRSERDARFVFDDACSAFGAQVASLEPRFSFRTWLYALARRAAGDFRRPSTPPPPTPAPAPSPDEDPSDAIPPSRTESWGPPSPPGTPAAIRDGLTAEDRALLVLRIDRGMTWDEIAQIFGASDLEARFRALVDEIRAQAAAAGLL
jgi:RNA polymerase sigma-70 factor (ECF subfamily)